MNLKRTLSAAVIVASAALHGASTASASPIFFTDRAAFNAAVGGGLTFESFEGDFGVLPSHTFGNLTVSETNGIDLVAQARDYSFMSFVITDGTGAIWFDDNNDSVGHFSFAVPINAFGVDIGTSESSTVVVGGAVSSSIFLSAMLPSFWGVYDPSGSFTEITFTASGGPNIGWDALSYGVADPIPEPTTLLLMGGGLLGLATRRRHTS
jgi:hypothetical protein